MSDRREETGGVTPLRFGVISKTAAEWPTFVLKDRGIDREHGLDVELVFTGAGPASAQALVAGDVAIAEVRMDNTMIEQANGAPLRMIGGSFPYYRAAMMGRPGIAELADLKGGTIAVATDNPMYALIVDQMRRAGVEPSEWTPVAPTVPPTERYAWMTSGAVDAAIMVCPYEFEAQRDGFTLLVDLGEQYPDYGFLAIGVSEASLAAQRPALERFMAAYAASIDWLLDAANAREATALLVEHTTATGADAEDTYDLLIKQKTAFARDGVLPPRYVDGVQAQLRSIGMLEQERPADFYLRPLDDVAAASSRASED